MLNKEELLESLQDGLCYSNQTSYKFYFFLSILKFCESTAEMPLNSLSAMMLALAWNDVSKYSGCFRQKDMLPRLKQHAMFKLGLFEYEESATVYMALIGTKDEALSEEVRNITWYVSHFFLDRRAWRPQWNGMFFYDKMDRLAEISQTDDECLYKLGKGVIEVRNDYFYYLHTDPQIFYEMARKELERYFEKRAK